MGQHPPLSKSPTPSREPNLDTAENQNLTSKFEHNPAKKQPQYINLGTHIKHCSLKDVLVCFEEIISAQNLPGLTHKLQV